MKIKRTSKAGAGALRAELEFAAIAGKCGLSDLTVLAEGNDPYRFDTRAGHRAGAWFKEQVDRFIPPGEVVHLRGLHYRLVASADAIKVNGKRYENTAADWNWLSDIAAKAGRWLGYVPFARIVDERNAAPEIFVQVADAPWAELSEGRGASVPGLEEALPEFVCSGFVARQPYRIILIGEKSSLKPVLLPVAQRVNGELLLATGETSETLIAEMASRSARDDRPSVVLYFADFDPSGHQMAISVSRKLQAHRTMYHRNLNIQVHHVALTLEQVNGLGLPSTPLKDTELRANRWREKMRHEQTEIDALAALRPEELRRIADDAIRPFYDPTLYRRTQLAKWEWEREAAELIETNPSYQPARNGVMHALEELQLAANALTEAQERAYASLEAIGPPPLVLPTPEISISAPEPLFSTNDDYAEASIKLKSRKALEDEDEAA